MGEETSRYDAVAVALHWLIGVALLAQITFGFLLDEIAPRGTPSRSDVDGAAISARFAQRDHARCLAARDINHVRSNGIAVQPDGKRVTTMPRGFLPAAISRSARPKNFTPCFATGVRRLQRRAHRHRLGSR